MDASVTCLMYSHSKPPPLGSSPVQTPHSAHSVQLLLLLMLIVPLYFIAVFAVREKKRRKQDQHLREMVVPPNQVKMSNADIDSKILVVDGGGGMSPPIRPPHGIWWCSIPVQDLHIEDELCGDIGIFFPRIDGTSPFICLPR